MFVCIEAYRGRRKFWDMVLIQDYLHQMYMRRMERVPEFHDCLEETTTYVTETGCSISVFLCKTEETMPYLPNPW